MDITMKYTFQWDIYRSDDTSIKELVIENKVK